MSQTKASASRVPNLGRFRLGEWLVNQAEGTLCMDGSSVRLEPRVMDVLVLLASEQGNVVSKDYLLETVWGGAFVEEGALSQAIHSLRKALGDDPRQPRYIQTIPKRGYRLLSSMQPELVTAPPGGLPEPAVVPASDTGAASRRWAWLVVAIVGLATVFLLMLLGRERRSEARMVPGERSSAATEPGLPPRHGPRIAVLPFEDLNKPDDPYFSVGLTQEITKDLGSLPSLQVIHRVVPSQRESPKPPHEVGRDLGVDYVLVGTVQWARQEGGKSRVRIRPQLIGVDGIQAWAGSFDSEIADVFAVQAEISRRLIASLGIELLPDQQLALREPSTQNLEAHEAYTRGLIVKNQPFYSDEDLRKAARMFDRAVRFDPKFAAAWAELSMVHSYLAYNTDPSPSRVKQARQALEQAIALDPDLPEVRLAGAYVAYRCDEDFDGALAQLTAAARLYPNNAEISKAFGVLLRRTGKFVEAIEALKHAAWLDPKTGELVWILAETHRALRNFEEADEAFAQAISQAPDEPFFWAQRALNQLAWTGDPEQASEILEESGLSENPVIEAVAFRIDLYKGDYEKALARLSGEWMKSVPPETKARIDTIAAVVRERAGDHQGALAAAEANRAFLQKNVARYPKRAFYRVCLAVALAQLGRRQEALAQAREAATMRQADAFSGPRIIEIQALVDVTLGRHQQAVDHLARLLSTPYRDSLTTTDLQLDLVWEPLRGAQDFNALIQRSAR